ncbi:MAG TPA: intradiol ring-cleavage dioxygenase [Allosphingosinicella sp.]|nr:intradiol ring-cleavage dioxygenase [Allosphingosinicella sp.]
MRPLLGRRDIMTGMGAAALAPLLACAREPQAAATARPGRLIAGTTCPLTPRQTEGPFYFDPRLVRQDIREGRPGARLRLRLQVVGASDCSPALRARVDIWHCDSAGVYSGYESERSAGEKWLRGTQFADANGVVAFETLYPGWYEGRATHVHCKVTITDGREVTSQIYFPDALSDRVYAESAYRGRGGRRVRNDEDGIFRQAGGSVPLAQPVRSASGFDGAVVLALR